MTAIVIFAKAPVAGTVKTRLVPRLGAVSAALLHAHMLEHVVGQACAAEVGAVTLACAPSCDHALFVALAERYGVALLEQGDGDLGARMARAMARVLAANEAVILIGADCPGIDPGYLAQAAAALEGGSDIVIGPAEDGGYVLIGARVAYPAMFAGIAWGSGAVLAATRAKLDRSGLRVRELTLKWDVDRPEDLDRLALEFPGFIAAAGIAARHNPRLRPN